MERGLIRTRMSLGYADYIAKRKLNKDAHPVGRPSSYRKSDEQYKEQYSKEISLIRKGISLRNVSKLTGVSINTLRKLQSYV
jgi:DNA invertase Pin-like site-specific DNA recombinase